jgi:outer membrane protein assembly factor BamA
VISVEEAKDLAIDVRYGVGAATLNPTYVFLRPKFPNLWGTGWDFDIDGLYGFDWSAIGVGFQICDDQPCYEQSARTTLSHPHIFGSVLDFDLVGQVQRRVTPARGQIFSAYGNPRLSYRITEEWSIYIGYLIQQANISKDLVKPLGAASGLWVNRSGAVVPDRTGLIETGVRLSRADNPFNPNSGYLAGLDFKLASPYLGGQDWWARIDLTWQHFIPIPRTRERLSFRYSLRFGEAFPINTGIASTQSVPEVWRYYGGGTADLGIRGILPETMLVDYEEVVLPYGGTLRRPRAQGGHIRGIGTVAWQVVSVKDFLGGKLAHSLFYDFGVLFQRWSQLNFARDYRHSIGVNVVKWDIDIVTLALGYAILVPGNARPTDDRNGRVVFDVGVTF